MLQLTIENLPSPVGDLTLIASADALYTLEFANKTNRLERAVHRFLPPCNLVPGHVPARFRDAVQHYFAGQIDAVADLPVVMGGSPFQQRVWQTLRQIPAGKVWSYGQLAAAVGNPKGSRAVGLANGANPIAIVVPCHRVIGANGALTGYGGGLPRKQWLLRHEGFLPPEEASLPFD